ncbi:hypothetical protein BaRGS_00005497 [Batillaria attramentaria]|uniref:Hyaluronidase n=1 Tax=Batillaria attramentaria TaxID=370345 RepID=A0ABD0LW95_9CAEN
MAPSRRSLMIPVVVLICFAVPHHAAATSTNYPQRESTEERRQSPAANPACGPGFQEPSEPFQVIWNHPDPCESRASGHVPMNFSHYGIVANSNRHFLGDRVKVYYHSGNWPKYSGNQPINGGLPQRVSDSHYIQAAADFRQFFTQNFTGFGVIDFETWRPLFFTNFGSLSVYQQQSRALVRQQHPDYNQSMVDKTAAAEFDRAARMSWLWHQSTGLYPSIYLRHPDKQPVDSMAAWVTSVVKESVRIQAKFTQPNTPIVPFSLIQNNPFDFFNKTILEVAIGLPAEMGASGVILWGSSALYRQAGQCKRLQTYVRDILGPYVRDLTDFMTDCSQQLCGGHGRCVRNDLDFLQPTKTRPKPSSETCGTPHPRFHDYHCRCYSAWAGTCCQRKILLPCQQTPAGVKTELIGK